MNVFEWMRGLSMKLQEAFGCRIVFIGLQSSRARGEAHEGSDIDAVVLLDSLGAEDLVAYRGIIEGMPHSELACGFIGSADVLASWPRHELLQFYNDTVPICGQPPEIAPFSKRDALEAARIGASGIYHAACHALAFDGADHGIGRHPRRIVGTGSRPLEEAAVSAKTRLRPYTMLWIQEAKA